MAPDTVLSEEQLFRQATDALIDRLGMMETTRFLSIISQGRVDSVERHRIWQDGLKKDEFFDEVFNNREGNIKPAG